VKFGGEVKRGDGAFGLKNAVIGTISKAYGADTLTTTYKVETALEEIKDKLPKDIQMNIRVFRQADFIESSIHNLREALIEGGIIVSIVLILFLMNWRAALISCLAMPVSLLGGILILDSFGIGLNVMTLGGLAIAIGEVVDDAIIDVENVFRRLRLNRALPNPDPVLDVVFRASSEIRNSVVYATLIVMLVFAPIFFLTGLEGRIFTPLGIAYIGSVWCSLVVALTLTPALCYMLLGKAKGHKEEKEGLLVRFLKRVYRRVLQFSLKHFYAITGMALVLIVTAGALIPFFGRSFLPEFHEGNFIIAMTTLPGTSLEESMRLGTEVRKKLLEHKQVVSISQRAGRSELDEDAQPPNFSEFDVKLDFDKDKSIAPDQLLRDIREELSGIPGTAFNVGQFIAHRFDEILSGVRAQVTIKIYGPNLDVLRKKGQEVLNAMQTVKGVEDLQMEQQINVPQLVIKFDREKASLYGLKVQDLAESVETLLGGSIVSQVIEGQKSFDLFVRLNDASRKDINAIQSLLIDARSGEGAAGDVKIPLAQVADVHFEERPYFINREDVPQRNYPGEPLQSTGSRRKKQRGSCCGRFDEPSYARADDSSDCGPRAASAPVGCGYRQGIAAPACSCRSGRPLYFHISQHGCCSNGL
jgi:Cu/Ag efflux pump CusA